jgi:DNA invertase Pin-like site-specific DNA recombinase
MLGAIAAFENDLRKERQADGIALAKRRGVQFGRKVALTQVQVMELRKKRSEGMKIVELMDSYKVSKASIYRALAT